MNTKGCRVVLLPNQVLGGELFWTRALAVFNAQSLREGVVQKKEGRTRIRFHTNGLKWIFKVSWWWAYLQSSFSLVYLSSWLVIASHLSSELSPALGLFPGSYFFCP